MSVSRFYLTKKKTKTKIERAREKKITSQLFFFLYEADGASNRRR